MDLSSITALFKGWLDRPFDPEGNAFQWVLFLGFVLIVAYGWHKVIRSITTE